MLFLAVLFTFSLFFMLGGLLMTREQALEIFARGLEHFRHRKGYTMDQLGKIIGCGRANIHKIKERKNFTSMEGLFYLIEDGMTLYEIFGTDLAEKLVEEMKEVLPEQNEKKDNFDTPEFRDGVAKVIAELVAKGHDAINPLK